MMDKVETALTVLRDFEPPEGYYLAFSGGKDSQVILKLAEMAGVRFDAHFNLTTVDPPEVVCFIREKYSIVKIEYPTVTMWDLIVKEKYPPTRRVKYCCEYLKEKGGEGRFVILGVRKKESNKRSKRQLFEHCYKYPGRRLLNPIIEWSYSEVWTFIRKYIGFWCKLYDDPKIHRIGCIMCPYSSRRERERELHISNIPRRVCSSF